MTYVLLSHVQFLAELLTFFKGKTTDSQKYHLLSKIIHLYQTKVNYFYKGDGMKQVFCIITSFIPSAEHAVLSF